MASAGKRWSWIARSQLVITRADIVRRVAEWQLAEEVVEKDYVLGWLLWRFGSDPVLGQNECSRAGLA